MPHETEVCKTCGQHILMMCQKFTGYCSAVCEDEGKGKGWQDDHQS